uniref:Uncharacterized protein n=1 Tax=Amphimedon queenslandica TaxID=400682 RepID=A0A1X7UD27_AMPQE
MRHIHSSLVDLLFLYLPGCFSPGPVYPCVCHVPSSGITLSWGSGLVGLQPAVLAAGSPGSLFVVGYLASKLGGFYHSEPKCGKWYFLPGVSGL